MDGALMRGLPSRPLIFGYPKHWEGRNMGIGQDAVTTPAAELNNSVAKGWSRARGRYEMYSVGAQAPIQTESHIAPSQSQPAIEDASLEIRDNLFTPLRLLGYTACKEYLAGINLN